MIDMLHPNYKNTPVSQERVVYGYRPADVSAEPVISIVTPYFNTGPVFLETAQSVLGQSFQQWEWVIVNDGSTKTETLEVIAPFRSMDPRIRVIDQANKGLAGARNTGIRATKAPYLFFLDSDDLLEPTTLEYLLWKVYGDERLSFATSYLIGFGGQTYLWTRGFNTTEQFLDENMVSVMSLVRRDVVERAGMFDEQREIATEDYDFWLRCASLGYWGADIAQPLLWYRRRPSNANGDIRDQSTRYATFRQEMRTKYADLYRNGMPSAIIDDPSTYTALHPVEDTVDFQNILARPDGVRRMLMLVPWMNLGGADKFNLDLIDQLQLRGWQVSVCSTLNTTATWLHEYTRRTPDVLVLPSFLRRADYPRFLTYFMRSRQIDTVLIANSELAYLLLPYLRTHFPDVTFVDYCHMEEEYWRNGGYPRYSVASKAFLDLSIVSSQHLRDWMIERGGSAERITVCTTNIDIEDWDPARFNRQKLRSELGLSEDEIVILYAGRLAQQKQPAVFAEVMRLLQQRGHRFTALVAGDGPERQRLEQQVREHKLSQIRMLGSVSQDRIHELLALSDIFFLPSQMEGISLAIYEAMAVGLATVGADVGGQRELLTPECGILVKRGPSEVQEYVAALERVLLDSELRRSMGANSRLRVQDHFQLSQMGQNIVHAFEAAQAHRRSTAAVGIGIQQANALAVMALEQLRLSQVVEHLWMARSDIPAGQPAGQRGVGRLIGRRDKLGNEIQLIAWKVRKTLWPLYNWGRSHGMSWLVPLREMIYEFMQRLYSSSFRNK